ncbi:hypothetical protein K474DRAFT_1602155 [Panus rudis PR-1116 ss-1]|nr:hypothetical protein K474DRAFT_1602155 [Panus rudis PR-1116 ss-1]
MSLNEVSKETSNEPACVHSDTFYFPNGDIVLSAPRGENATTKEMFRVHMFMLAHHSPVFSDMFACSDADSSINDKYDGAPLVELSDNAQELTELLRILYHPDTLLSLNKYPADVPILIRGPLRLASKYQIEPLRERLVELFLHSWPKTLTEFDSAEKAFREKAFHHQVHGDRQFRINDRFAEDSFPEPASAIQLARELDIRGVLPAAFYSLARIPFDNDRETRHKLYGPAIRTARWCMLDLEGHRQVIRGREKLMFWLLGEAMQSLQTACRSVCRTTTCAPQLAEFIAAEILDNEAILLDPLHLLGMLDNSTGLERPDLELCESCWKEVCQVAGPLRQAIWSELPEMFSLE